MLVLHRLCRDINAREKPKEFIAQGKYDDAIACAMAEGIRMGWDAHKKKVENNNTK